MEVDERIGYKLLVWTTADGVSDVRCNKCAHFFPSEAREPDKSRNNSHFPLGQCAESVTRRRIMKLAARIDNAN
jgi:hypothetical protein